MSGQPHIVTRFCLAVACLCVASMSTAHSQEADFFAHPTLYNTDFITWSQGLQNQADELRGMTDEQIINIVPKSPGEMVLVRNPVDLKQLRDGGLHYDPLVDPNHFTHVASGNTFPDNPNYPMTLSVTHKLPTCPTHPPGHPTKTPSTVTYPYSETDGYEIYQLGMLDTLREDWLQPRMVACGKMYILLRDSDPALAEEYAHAAAVALKAYADAYPRYPLVANYGKRYTSTYPDYPESGWVAEWDETRVLRRAAPEINGPGTCLETMDLIFDSQAVQNYSDSVSGSLGNIVDYCYEGFIVEGWERNYGMTGFSKDGQTMPGLRHKRVALVFNDIDLLRKIPQAFEKSPFTMGYGADGLYMEGPGYAGIQQLNYAQMREMNGYSDPNDYVINPPTGILTESEAPHGPPHNGYSLYNNFRFPPPGPYEDFVKKTFTSFDKISLPDSGQVIWNDASNGQLGEARFAHRAPRERSENVMLWGGKHVMLGDGVGDEQVQVHMGFGTSRNHTHEDTLHMQIYDNGHYLINDFPRDLGALENWHQQTKSHNTVTLNQSQQDGDEDGDPLMYEPTMPGVSVVSVGAAKAYHAQGYQFGSQPNNYARTLILNTVDINRPYVVDVFRVKGIRDVGAPATNQTRDYMLRSSSMHRQTASITTSMSSTTESTYSHFYNPTKGSAESDFKLTYQCQTPWPAMPTGNFHWPEWLDQGPYPDNTLLPYRATAGSWSSEPAIGTTHHVIAQPNMDVYLFEVPWLARISDGLPESDYVNEQKIPKLMLRDVRPEEEETLFVVVHEMWAGSPHINSVQSISTLGTTTEHQGENYANQSGTQVLTGGDYTGSGYLSIPSDGDWAEWTVNAQITGNHTLTFRYGLGGIRPVNISVNGTVVEEGLSFPGTGGETTFATYDLDADLNAGNNTIRIEASAGDLLLDNFDNGDIATGGSGDVEAGFTINQTSHGAQVYEAGGTLTLDCDVANGNWGKAEVTSLSPFDAVGTGAYSATFTINSFQRTDRDRTTAFALRPNNNGLSLSVNDQHSVAGLALQINGQKGDVVLTAADTDGDDTTARDLLHQDLNVNMSELEDGFTVTLSADASGWSISVTGAASFESASGAWGAHDYNTVFSDTTFVKCLVNDGTDKTAKLVLDSVKVSPAASSLSPLAIDKFDSRFAIRDLVALQIDLGDRTDRVLLSTSGEVVNFVKDDLQFSGRLGVIAESSSGQRDAYLVGGSLLSDTSANVNLTRTTDAYTGTVSHTTSRWLGEEDAIVVPENTAIPTGTALNGQWVLLSNYSSGNGGGWCAEIDRVETAGGVTTIYTADSHGLRIDPNGLTEWHLPYRSFPGATTYTIHTKASNQSDVYVTPAGGAFLEPVSVTCTTAAEGGDVHYSLDDGVSWNLYVAPININSETTLLVRSVDTDGLKTAVPDEYKFTFDKDATNVPMGELTPGLARIRSDSENGPAVEQEIVPTFTIDAFLKDHLLPHGESAWFYYDGYLNVPADGVYTIHYRPDLAGGLTLDGDDVLPMEYYRDDPNAGPKAGTHAMRSVDVALRAGLHPIEMVHYVAPNDRWTPSVDFEWESDAMARRPIVQSDLYTSGRPRVDITAPNPGEEFIAGSVTVAADASDMDGSVSQVDFYANGSPIGTDASAPYSISWANVTAGNYTLTAVATDNDGLTGTSDPINISVQPETGIALFRDDFEDGDIGSGSGSDVNGGFHVNKASRVIESGGNVLLDASDGGNYETARMWSKSGFDPNGASKLVWTIVVDSFVPDDSIHLVAFALQPSGGQSDIGSAYGNDGGPGLYIQMANNASVIGLFAKDVNGANPAEMLHEDSSLNSSELEDGFTIQVEVSDGGWTWTVLGAASMEDASGGWGPSNGYGDVFGSSTYVKAALKCGTDHDLKVEVERIAVSGVTLSGPTSLAAVAASETQVDLTWTDNAQGETGQVIERSLDGSNWSQVMTVAADVTSYSDTGLSGGTTYHYRVAAYDATEYSGYSNTAVVTTPAVITALFRDTFCNGDLATGDPDDVNAGFTFNDNGRAIATEAGGFLTLDSTDGGDWTRTSLWANNAFDGAAESQIVWTIVVDSWTGSNHNKDLSFALEPTGGWSAIGGGRYDKEGQPGVSLQMAKDSAAFGLFAQDVGGVNTRDKLHEDTSFNVSELEDGFVVTVTLDPNGWSVDVEGAPSVEDASGSWGTSGYADVFNSTTFVKASIMDGTLHAAKAVIDSITVNAELPAKPTDLTATAASTSQIDLSWTDNAGSETGYRIERSPDGSTWTEIATVGANVTSYSDTGLSEATLYHYRVLAYDGGATSDCSNFVSAMTQTTSSMPLFMDTFDDGDISVGGAGDVIAGFSVTDTSRVYESAGNATLDASNSGGNWKHVMMWSDNAFDGAAQPEIKWTIVVDSWTGSDRPTMLAFALEPTGGNTGLAGKGYDPADLPGLSVQLSNDGAAFGLFAQDVDSLNTRDKLHEDTSFNTSQLEDGFTIEVIVNASGWNLNIAGADSLESASGGWGTSGFYDVFNTTTYVKAGNRDGTDKSAITDVASITVEMQ